MERPRAHPRNSALKVASSILRFMEAILSMENILKVKIRKSKMIFPLIYIRIKVTDLFTSPREIFPNIFKVCFTRKQELK